MCRFSKLLLFSSARMAVINWWDRASCCSCVFLCVSLAAAYLKYHWCHSSCLPLVWRFLFIVTQTHTHTHACMHIHTFRSQKWTPVYVARAVLRSAPRPFFLSAWQWLSDEAEFLLPLHNAYKYHMCRKTSLPLVWHLFSPSRQIHTYTHTLKFAMATSASTVRSTLCNRRGVNLCGHTKIRMSGNQLNIRNNCWQLQQKQQQQNKKQQQQQQQKTAKHQWFTLKCASISFTPTTFTARNCKQRTETKDNVQTFLEIMN